MPGKKPPDILIIISDQQRYDTIPGSCTNAIRTPNLKKLAKHSVTYTNAFCATPICTPSRTSIFSGLYPHAHGLPANHQSRPGPDDLRLDQNILLLPDYLKQFGYNCAYSGKWHLATGSDRRGFTDIHGKTGNHDVDKDDDNDFLQYARKIGIELKKKKDGNQPDPQYYDSFRETGASLFALQDHPSTFCCNKAVDFISESANKNDPFCLVYSCHEPHPPFISPTPFHNMYDPDDIILPPNFTLEPDKTWLTRPGTRLRGISEYNEKDLKTMWAAYLGAVSFVDHLTGKLLSAVSAHNIYEDSLIIFMSDHGEMLGSHGFFHKGAALCDELVKIPLIIKYPSNENQNSINQDLISNVDILPTIIDLCTGKAISSLQGNSYYKKINANKAVMAQYHSSNWTDPVCPLRMWRTHEWKYIESAFGDNELYHLENDPYEKINLYDDLKYSDILRKLRDELYSFMKANGDDFPLVVMPNIS